MCVACRPSLETSYPKLHGVANIGLEQLLLDNVDRLDRLDVPVVGKQLLICNPKPRTQPSSEFSSCSVA
jgi:hypothetical protein